MAEIMAHPYSGVVLSPGPERPSNAGNLMDVIAYYENKLPVLGICLGHQAIGQHFGASLQKATYPMHGKVSRIKVSKGILFQGIPDEINVVRYHSLILRNLPETLKPVAFTDKNELMAFESTVGNMVGIQFHPEAVLTEYGLEMLKNWASFSNIV